MILPDVQAILGLDAFLRDAWPHDFGQAVNVDGVHVEGLFDLLAHGVGPRLRAEDADLQRTFARVETLASELVEDRQHVGRCDHDDRWLEVLDQRHLALRHAAGDRNDGAAEPLGAVVGAKPAGEEAVAIGDVQDVAGASAGRLESSGR